MSAHPALNRRPAGPTALILRDAGRLRRQRPSLAEVPVRQPDLVPVHLVRPHSAEQVRRFERPAIRAPSGERAGIDQAQVASRRVGEEPDGAPPAARSSTSPAPATRASAAPADGHSTRGTVRHPTRAAGACRAPAADASPARGDVESPEAATCMSSSTPERRRRHAWRRRSASSTPMTRLATQTITAATSPQPGTPCRRQSGARPGRPPARPAAARSAS